ncbi:MAG TPA: hypothetical protein VFO62_10570 [Candidatus Binatia bacterium]|nr:hypothetical protein [Candidatus Binatia bacterium]
MLRLRRLHVLERAVIASSRRGRTPAAVPREAGRATERTMIRRAIQTLGGCALLAALAWYLRPCRCERRRR